MLQSAPGGAGRGQVRSYPAAAYMATCLHSLPLIFLDIIDLKVTPRIASRSGGKWKKLLCGGEAATLHRKSTPSKLQGETTEWPRAVTDDMWLGKPHWLFLPPSP